MVNDELRNSQQVSMAKVASGVNDQNSVARYATTMAKVTRIHAGKQPVRPHHISEWAELRGLKQADVARELDIDKSVVSRWWKGASPSANHQQALAELFNCEPESLFRHPGDDWLAKFFKDRSVEEIDRIKQTLEIAFPRKKRA